MAICSRRIRCLCPLLVGLMLAAMAVPAVVNAQSAAPGPTDEQVESARLNGLDFLRKNQTKDGSWEYEGHNTGLTALATLALLENGAPIYDPVVEKGYRYVKKNAPDRKETYDITLSILLLARVGDRQDRSLIRTLGARLLAGQTVTGGWSYTCPAVDSSILQDLSRVKRQEGAGCNSNTQFGVLGLWVASRYGVPIEEAMKDVGSRFVSWQGSDGGWPYTKKESEAAASGEAMSCAGLFCLTVARATKIRQQLKESKQTSSQGEKEALLADPVYKKGLTKVSQLSKTMHPGSARYFVWSVERVGVLLGLEKFEGDSDWFKIGADALIKSQKEDGSWPADKLPNTIADTSFATLFLRKANLGSDISRLLNGKPEKAFSIVNREGVDRADTLDEILAASQPGDIIRIDGNGPFKTNHNVIDKNLTIQAGFGYDPVLEYQLGTGSNGLRYRPEKDKESHQMLHVKSGVVTLEGLRLQFDAPPGPATIVWKGILVTGGTLRMLNCSISEGNKKGMVAVLLAGEGTSVIRNSILVGGRAAVEVVANDKQDVTIENSILFSNTCVSVVNNPETKAPADVDLHLYQSILQGNEAIGCSGLAGNLRINSILSAYKSDALGLSLLVSEKDKTSRTWNGSNNCYNLTNWIGVGGKKLTTVTDPKSFSKFWGDTDKDHSKLTLAYVTTRKTGAYAHGLSPQDWDISEKSELALQVKRPGVHPVTVGSGDGFARYREDFHYGTWKKGLNTSAVLSDIEK